MLTPVGIEVITYRQVVLQSNPHDVGGGYILVRDFFISMSYLIGGSLYDQSLYHKALIEVGVGLIASYDHILVSAPRKRSNT